MKAMQDQIWSVRGKFLNLTPILAGLVILVTTKSSYWGSIKAASSAARCVHKPERASAYVSWLRTLKFKGSSPHALKGYAKVVSRVAFSTVAYNRVKQ